MLVSRRLPFGCRAASKALAERVSSRAPRRSTASRCASGIRCAYVESVTFGEECPRTPAAVRTSTPATSSVVAAVCRRSCRRVVEIPALRATRSKAQVAAIGVTRRPNSSVKTAFSSPSRRNHLLRARSLACVARCDRKGSSANRDSGRVRVRLVFVVLRKTPERVWDSDWRIIGVPASAS